MRLKSKYYILKFIFDMVWEIVEDNISQGDGLGGGLRGIGLTALRAEVDERYKFLYISASRGRRKILFSIYFKTNLI